MFPCRGLTRLTGRERICDHFVSCRRVVTCGGQNERTTVSPPPAPSSNGVAETGRFCFGNVVLDADRREIRVEGRPCETQPKVFDLLLYLIVHRDRVVDKDELMSVLWPEVVVTEASLTQALKKARKVVGDDGDRQAVIKTVQRRGFRFIATLEPALQPAARLEDGRVDGSASVAVLPFADMSPSRDQRHFCDGMAEEIINALTRVEGLRVSARTSSFAFNASADVRQIGAALGVGSVVEGSVRRAGDRLRVVAQLIDAGSGFHRWSERWDRPVADVFSIQDEIATRVAEALKEHLTNADRAAISAARPRELSAYELYLRGLAFRNRFGRRSQRFALEMFHRALAIDAEYAAAWAGVATSHMLLYYHADASEQHRQLAAEAGERAVRIDPHSAEAWVACGAAAGLQGDSAEAERSFSRAQHINPQLFEAWYYHGRACARRGDHARAVELYETAARVRPEDYEALNVAVQSYKRLGQEQQALSAMLRSAAAADRAVALNPDDVRALSLGCGPLILLGRHEQARDWLQRACTLEPDEPDVQYNAACAYAALGEHERALDMLEALAGHAGANRSWMENDAWLDPIRNHVRFRALLAHAPE